MISDGRARRIASEWHGGMWSPLYMLTSSGATRDNRYDHADVLKEIRENLIHTHSAALCGLCEELDELVEYVESVGDRGPVKGWHELWEAS